MLLGYKATDYSRWGQLQLARDKSKRLFFKNDPYIIKKDKKKKKNSIQHQMKGNPNGIFVQEHSYSVYET